MPNSPEAIIAAIEERWAAEKRNRRRTFFLRAMGLLRIVAISAGFVILARNVTPSMAIFAGTILFIYLAHNLQKRWVLEDELKKMKDEKARDSSISPGRT